jgi:hypothetical protein
MKKVIFIFLSIIVSISVANAQKDINFNRIYPGGGKLLMCVDSLAKNIYYANVFPNQPNTTFNYLPEVNNVSIQINFRKNINAEHYRYTILIDDKPIMVNKAINKSQLTDTHAGGDDEIFGSTSLGTFAIKGKIITVLVYSIDKPQNIEKSIFYGKPIQKAKIKSFGIRFAVEKGVDYRHITDPKEDTKLTFTDKDDELTIVKEWSDIDYIYFTSIKDKKTNKVIFDSTTWEYGGYVDEARKFSPYLNVDKSIFKQSGDYEIIIQPSSFARYKISSEEMEKYTTRYTLSIRLEEENYTGKQLGAYIGITCAILSLISGLIMIYIKRKNKAKLLFAQQQKQTAQLQLNSVHAQLNPHFLFNALAGIQNLMNKNETENANKYLTKFARLTRNVLNSKELISLAEEKALLDDYLQMEQLRFGFKYEIDFSEDLNIENIEIPAMLLQPFVENAVKHGIAEQCNGGKIEIKFAKRDNDLTLSIKDNGKGFDAGKVYNGLGLELSKNRISLLNTIYKETPLLLDIQSGTTGTVITITLTQWL